MYNSYQIPSNFNNFSRSSNNSDERFIAGGFLGPFLLGGLTGGLVSPLFYNQRPYYNNNYYYPPYPRPYPPRPYPPYRPY